MKLYHFNPNDYGEEYFVMAEDKTQAHLNLLKYFEEEIKKCDNDSWGYECRQRDLELWKNINPLDKTTFPDEFTLDEYEKGQVVRSEIA